MRIVIVGAGAIGGMYGARLLQGGADVTLIDGWPAHVDAINREGLRIGGIRGEAVVRARAATSPEGLGPFDAAIVLVDTNHTRRGAEMALACLAPDGFAMTMQNGIGNVETLIDVLGRARVVPGLSYHSAAMAGPGHVMHTNAGKTWLGELDGQPSARTAAMHEALNRAEMDAVVVPDIMSTIWTKWVLNCAVNPVAAVTGLRVGEIGGNSGVDAFQTKIIDEILAVLAAKGVTLTDPDIKATIKTLCRTKFNKPSMLQHVEAGRRTEIASLNAAAVRLGQEAGVPTPMNEALVALIGGVEESRHRALHLPAVDYAAAEREAVGLLHS